MAANIITPAFVADLETRIQLVLNEEFQRLVAGLNYQAFTKERPSAGKREIFTWLLDNATIDYVGRLGAEVKFEDILARETEVENKSATDGLELNRAQMTDTDSMGVVGGAAINLSGHWARQVGALSAYWPQEQAYAFIRDGGEADAIGYDGERFFSTQHPINPFDDSVGVFANDFTSTASGVYPGAVPIHGNTFDVALENLAKVRTYVKSIKMPNGRAPRKLRIRAIMCPPALESRVQQLTQAKFIAQGSAGGGGGTGDVSAVIADMGFGVPVVADELSSSFPNGSDTTYYVLAETLMSDQLGGLVYVNREPFSVVFNGEMTSAELSRRNTLQWILRGRNALMYGHPYLIFRCQAA